MKTKFCSVLVAATTFLSIIATTGSANAASLTRTSPTDYAPTDIIDTPLSIQKFDSDLGTLNSVEINFTSNLKGDAGFENRSPQAAQVTVDLASQVALKLNNQSLFTLSPENTSTYQVDAQAQKTVEGLTANKSETKTFTDSNLLQSFIGTSNLDFLFSTLANSTVAGPGNISSYVNTYAKAGVNVTYNYDDKKPPKKVSEPSAVLGIGLVAGFRLLSQRKRSFSKA